MTVAEIVAKYKNVSDRISELEVEILRLKGLQADYHKELLKIGPGLTSDQERIFICGDHVIVMDDYDISFVPKGTVTYDA